MPVYNIRFKSVKDGKTKVASVHASSEAKARAYVRKLGKRGLEPQSAQ